MEFLHGFFGKIAVVISTLLISVAGFISPPSHPPIATSTIEVTASEVLAPTKTTAIEVTTSEEVAATKIKAVETPVPKKVAPVAAPVKIEAPVQPVIAPVDSQLLIIEKCKAQRDITRGTLWPVMLDVIRLAEQQSQQARFDALAPTYQGTVTASDLMSMVKISEAEHEKNLQTAEAKMEAQLAKEYSACLSGN